MQVNWTRPSLEDLDGIFEFIARDSQFYAQNFVQQIMHAVDRLEVYPKSGRKIPEASGEELREIIFQGLFIELVFHGSLDL